MGGYPWAGILIAVDVVHVKETLFLRSVLLAALVVSTVVQPASLLGRLLEWKPLVWIGSISYSLYLWQELFLPVLSSEDARGPFAILQRSPWNLLAMLACACLSRYLLEIPMTKWGHRLSEPSTPRTERENSHLPRAPYLPA